MMDRDKAEYILDFIIDNFCHRGNFGEECLDCPLFDYFDDESVVPTEDLMDYENYKDPYDGFREHILRIMVALGIHDLNVKRIIRDLMDLDRLEDRLESELEKEILEEETDNKND